MQKPKMLVGQVGVKYGLQKRQEQSRGQVASRLSAFTAESDSDEDTVGAQVARQAARKVADSKVQEMYAAALAEDPNAFDYDAVYENIQEQKVAPKQQDRVDRKAKYIASLLEQAEVRKREEGITHERRLLKERQKEDYMFDNQEKFITSAYRKKLEEDKKWMESQKLKDLEDERNDVTKLGHMNNFFTNLNKNVALGGEVAPAQKQQQQQTETAGLPSAAVGKDHHHQQQQELRPAVQQPQDDCQQPDRSDGEHGHARQDDRHSRHHQLVAAPAAEPEQLHRQQPAAAAATGGQQQVLQTLSVPAAMQQSAGGKRKNDDTAVAAARERYLARKRRQVGV